MEAGIRGILKGMPFIISSHAIIFNSMELLLIKENSPEWQKMWEWIAQHPLNINLTPQQLNSWQYTGSLRQDNKTLHQFKRGTRSLIVACSPNMSNDDIHKIIALK